MSDESQPCLEIVGLSKSFVGTRALSSVDLAVGGGEVHALLGENGSGKSTLIKILSGYHVPDAGRILVGGGLLPFGAPAGSYALGCRFVHQDLGLIDSISVANNLSLTTGFPTTAGTIRGRELLRRARVALARVGLDDLDPRRLVGGLPPSVRTGVAVARALSGADESAVTKLLVLDEPTASLPDAEVDQLLGLVRLVARQGVAVLYVTHRLDEVFEIADDATVLRDGKKVITAPVKSMDRAALVRHLVGREFEEVHSAAETLVGERQGVVLRVTDVSAGPLQGISLEARAGEILGIAGITGSGRDLLLSVLFGAQGRDSGVVELDGRKVPAGRPDRSIGAGMAYLPAERKLYSGIMNLSARHNLMLPFLKPFWRLPKLRRRAEVAETKVWFERLDVRPKRGFDRPLATFSGGNQQKVLFAKWLRCKPRALLADEPTQGVDIGAKAEIHRQIIAAVGEGAAAIVASSDVDELVALCQRVLILRRGRLVAELNGDEITAAALSRHSLVAKEDLA